MTRAEKIKRLLAERGWSQAELARRAGLKQRNVAYIVAESRDPGISTCKAIAAALGESVDWLFDDTRGWEDRAPLRDSSVLPVRVRVTYLCNTAVSVHRLVAVAEANPTKIDHCRSNAVPIGVALAAGREGDAIAVDMAGMLEIEAGDTIAVNDQIISGPNGIAVECGAVPGTLYHVVGTAISPAVRGKAVVVLWHPYSIWWR